MIVDSYQRVHDYLRISLTDNCNMRCFYCMPQEDHPFTPSSKLMTADEIVALASVFVRLGVRRIRLTGGEPTVRKDFSLIAARVSRLPVELTLTTNATRIHHHLSDLHDAGIRSVNVSLDSLQPGRFLRITRRDLLSVVKKNIGLLVQAGIAVKVNVVVVRGVNDDEICDFVEWTRHEDLEVRFIEFMPFTSNGWSQEKVFSCQDILDSIASRFVFEETRAAPNATARPYHVPGHRGGFALIGTMTEPFCSSCNRLRLTADGRLKNCLFSSREHDLLTPFRNGESVEPIIHESLAGKARQTGGQFPAEYSTIDAPSIFNRSMISIGG